jgi:hypothetical protein
VPCRGHLFFFSLLTIRFCLFSFLAQGNWKNDHAHGEGTLIYAKGDVFLGEWANGVKNGQGQLTYKNGDLFQGSWVDDHANGHGTLQYHNGCKYEGEWKDDRRHGYGTFTDPKTQYKYEGQWHNSRRHGQGTMNLPNGDSFAGTWTAGRCAVVEFSFAANSPWADPEF